MNHDKHKYTESIFDECESEVEFNGDGSASINLPRSFLMEARKQWNTSCIGHFIGGSFPFKFVKDKVTKLWSNMGLKNVFFNSKGFFTFKFETIKEMETVLSLNSVNIGGKRLYLGPWTDGSQFKRNVIKSVSTWIKLTDVPHSYWSVKGLGNIAKVVGKPITLDNQTALLNPMKFAGILVQLQYGTSYPKSVWVPVINEEDGSIVKVKVGIEYSAVPQSCKFCQAFGHSDSKCASNPIFEKGNKGKKKKDTSNNTEATVISGEDTEGEKGMKAGQTSPVENADLEEQNVVEVADAAGNVNEKDNAQENVVAAETETNSAILADAVIVENAEENIEVAGIIDVAGSDANSSEVFAGNMDSQDAQVDLEIQDPVISQKISETTEQAVNPVRNLVVGLSASSTRPVRNATKVQSYNENDDEEEGEILTPAISTSAKSRKRRKNLKIKASNGPFTFTPNVSSPTSNSPSKKGKLVDADGFVQVVSKRGLRSQVTSQLPHLP